MGEKQPVRATRPVAIVALGDPLMCDDGVAKRVMGRVRPLLGEIALTGTPSTLARKRLPPSSRGAFAGGEPAAWIKAAVRPPGARGLERAPAGGLGAIVDWIEAAAPLEQIRSALVGRRRVVLIDAVCHDASPGHVQHWHLERRPGTEMNLVRFYQGEGEQCFDHLPFWLEDEIPSHGSDLIAIEPYRIEPGADLSPVLRSRMAAITSQVGGLLLRILEEEGWRLGRGPARRERRPRVA